MTGVSASLFAETSLREVAANGDGSCADRRRIDVQGFGRQGYAGNGVST